MAKRWLRFVLLGLLTTGFVLSHSSAIRARTTSVCDLGSEYHGPFTTTLCGGEHLYLGAYLVDGDYLLKFETDGAVNLFDISNSEDWQLVSHIRNGYEDPSILDAFSFDDEEGCLCAWNQSEIVLAPLDWDWIDNEGPDGDWFVELGSDGDIRVFDQGGGRLVRCYSFVTSCS